MAKTDYKRIVLKLSGEALMGDQKFGMEHKASKKIATSIKEIHALGVQIAVVVGGGNIFRGSQAKKFGFSRIAADQIGMVATIINGLILQQCLTSLGILSCVMSALPIDSIVEPYTYRKAVQFLEEDRVVIFVGGTAHPYFTTDTAAALRAAELNADILLKATKVDGIYDKDPMRYSSATKHPHLTYGDVLAKKLDVMDGAAVALCSENNIPIHVFNLFKKGALLRAIVEKKGGSLVTGE